MKKIFKIICIMCTICMICACSKNEDIPEESYPIVTMTIKDYGDIKIKLYPNYAPNTVANFVNLIEDGFYDNNAITRVQQGFVLQGGGIKNSSYTIKGEFSQNGYTRNNLSHEEGVISMARTSDKNSASGQFFIVLSDDAKSSLDGLYAGFGKVISGMDILHKIENDNHECEESNYCFLKEYITIEKTEVETYGYTYEVKKLSN